MLETGRQDKELEGLSLLGNKELNINSDMIQIY